MALKTVNCLKASKKFCGKQKRELVITPEMNVARPTEFYLGEDVALTHADVVAWTASW